MIRSDNVFRSSSAFAIALSVAASLGGCAAPVVPVPTTVETTGMPNAEEALRASMHHVDAEMAELGQLGPSVERPSMPVLPADLQREVSFSWDGPLDKAVAKLAASIGYTFYTSGPPGQPDVAVGIQISAVPVYQVFEALGAEAGTKATVQLDPLHHQVQVIHHA